MSKLFCAVAVCIAVFVGFCSFVSGGNNTVLVNDILRETNNFRRSKGLPYLVMRNDLNGIAAQHSADMANGNVAFGHKGFDERYEMAKNMIRTLYSFAENVAYGASTGQEVVNMWIHSAGHRRNLLGEFKYIGIGVASDGDGRIYYTQVFGG